MWNKVVPTRTKITGLGGKLIPVPGEIRLPITLGKCYTEQVFIVCDNLDNEFLIGMDLLNKIQAKIDLASKTIITPQGETTFLKKPISIKNRLKIRSAKNITIPAHSEGYLQAKIPIRNARENYEGIVEGYRKLSEEKGIFITGSMSYTDKNIIPIHYINVTEHPVTVYKNQLVAFFDPLEKDESVQGVHKVTDVSDYYDATINIPRLPDAVSVETTIATGKWSNPEELHKQLRLDELEIPEAYKGKLKSLITEYSHCFSRNRFDLGKASFYEATINLKRDYTPKWIPSRPVPYKHEAHMDEEIKNMIKADHITKCYYSLWNSPTYLIAKSNPSGDNKFRFIQDARGLNQECSQDHFELARIGNILDRMSNCKWLSNLDFQSSFTQVGLVPSAQPLTAFTYKNERYMWKRLVQGQTSSSAQFSRMVSQLFSCVPFESLILYLDDALLWSHDLESHLKKLRFFFDRLTWGNLKLNPHKTKLCQKEVRWLGHIVSAGKVSLAQDRVQAVKDLPPPKTVKQVQQLLGVLNYMRSFVKNFATMAAPLYNLLKKGTKMEWTVECQKSLDDLKSALSNSCTLSIPDLDDKNQSYQVVVDSSKRGQGATLSQIIDGKRCIIAFWSRAVPKHQQKYGATRLELLALHGALKHWSMYLLGTHFEVITDCKALLSDKIFKNENSFFQRRLSEIGTYSFKIRHALSDSELIKWPDFLSRYPYETAHSTKNSSTQTDILDSNPQSKIEEILNITEEEMKKPISIQEIRSEYTNDKILSTAIEWLNCPQGPKKPSDFNHQSESSELVHYWKIFELLSLKDGLLYRKWYDENTGGTRQLIVVPCTLVERTLYSCHNTLETCHAGVDACVEKCLQRFYFYKLKKEFKLYIGSCLQCARAKQPQAFLRAPLKQIVYSEFGQAISIDHLEPSKMPTPRGIVALMTICDCFSNYIVCVPVKSVDTETSVKTILEHWCLKFGFPNVIHHDLGSSFESNMWKAITQAFDMKNARTTPKYSQSNGRSEAANRKLNQCFRVTLSEKDWKNYDIYVKYIVFCLNSLACKRTKVTPNQIVFGKQLLMPRDLFINDESRLDETLNADKSLDFCKVRQARDMYKKVAEITRKVRDNSGQRAKYIQKQYDKKVRGPFFNVGDWCMLLELWPKHKYALKWKGPYKVIEKISNHNYVVMVGEKRKVVSISKMKHFKPTAKYFERKDKEELLNRRPKVADKNSKISNKKLGSTFDDDSDSNDGDDDRRFIISMESPSKKRRSPRLASKRKALLPQGPVAVTETEPQFAPKASDTDAWTTTDQQTTDANSTEGEEVPSRGQVTDADTSGESEFLDANEVLDHSDGHHNLESDDNAPVSVPHETGNPSDENTSTSLPAPSTSNSGPATSTRSKSKNPVATRSQPFGAVDSRVSLSDIEKLERTRHSGSKKASASTLVPTSSTTGTSRSNTRPGLRPNPTKTKKFGFLKLGAPKSGKSPK